MTVRYVIGPAYAVVRGDAVVVLPEKVTPELVDELWTALGDRAGVVPVLEVLTGSFGASLASLPPFAMAVADGRRVQVASRGGTSVTVARADAREHVSGEGVTTWAERTFDDVVDLSVQVGVTEPEELVDSRALPLDAGVALVTSVGARLTEDDAPAAPQRRREQVPEPWEEPEAQQAEADVPPPPAPPAPAVTAGPDLAPAPPAPATSAPEATMVPAFTVTPDDVPRPAEPPADDEGPAVPDPASDDVVEEHTDYGHLWGSTVHRAVEAAAIRPPGEDEGEEEPAESPAGPAPASPAGDSGSPEVVGAETAAPPADAAEPTIAEDPAGTAPPTDGDPGVDEIDGSTVLSSAIADLRAAATPAPDVGSAAGPAAPAQAGDPLAASTGVAPAPPGPSFAPGAVPGRPLILARSCTAGHPNPPQRDECAACGQSLVGEARQVPRPSLGVMGVSDGPRVTLDRPVVVGRRPRSPRAAGDDLPRLITVPSPQQDISRSHLEVRLEGWHVLISDMSTTNGTTLLRAGQPPLRLHPGEPVMVVAQDVVDLGDGVTLTFEGIL
ncbi:FHA domain-containing protein [Isoptericola sp. BMS4]|uniref:FHA domain-containing protein n=1 Tax=Isoptericola sp. BMS4 TaxID=2527875 RepID=UPI00272B4FFF|nr:FHA domain-containing protein [Isoptericola sp. BMS4]